MRKYKRVIAKRSLLRDHLVCVTCIRVGIRKESGDHLTQYVNYGNARERTCILTYTLGVLTVGCYIEEDEYKKHLATKAN